MIAMSDSRLRFIFCFLLHNIQMFIIPCWWWLAAEVICPVISGRSYRRADDLGGTFSALHWRFWNDFGWFSHPNNLRLFQDRPAAWVSIHEIATNGNEQTSKHKSSVFRVVPHDVKSSVACQPFTNGILFTAYDRTVRVSGHQRVYHVVQQR